ncbi:MAG: GPP34 family phosphoprotein, partial [Microbacterium sp.]
MTTADPGAGATRTDTLLAEDLLLLLFQPASGTIAGENTLFYVLGGAVVTELAQSGGVTIDDAGLRGHLVRAAGDTPPADPVLAQTWEYVDKPRGIQTVIAAMGPTLRGALLDRLVERGILRRESGRALGFIPTTTLELADTDRRAQLVGRLRAVLVDGAAADDRVASLIALISASGSLPYFDAEIPWNSTVATRGTAFERGDTGAEAAGQAVTRTMAAVVVNAMVAAAVLPGR